MGLSERFELITARSRSNELGGMGGPKLQKAGRPHRHQHQSGRKHTLASMISKESQRPRKPLYRGGGPFVPKTKADFQAELVARVAASSGPAFAHAGPWHRGVDSWGQAAAGPWPTLTARKLDLSMGTTRPLRGGSRGGKGRGAGHGGRGYQGLAIKWQRPPSAEEQAVLDAEVSKRTEMMDADLDEYWSQRVPT
eukprot:CAMPEP_0119058948 /NCGR_PEP_ID=MMETSP1178-20130426/3188_1 /TAXON_ID=33656 /ORGANISM="unid sp, Strain CCMP2000" /LENGTH=194 /DNA_ID=CAMNT_0007039939 /DNA_START=76 /DNA_END=663 /DNA_ORIENTATION=-